MPRGRKKRSGGAHGEQAARTSSKARKGRVVATDPPTETAPPETFDAANLGVGLGLLTVALLPLLSGGYSGAGYQLGFVVLPLAAALCLAARPLPLRALLVPALTLLPLLLIPLWLHSGVVLWYVLLHIPAAWIVTYVGLEGVRASVPAWDSVAAASRRRITGRDACATGAGPTGRGLYILPAAVLGAVAAALWGWALWLARSELGHHLTGSFGLPNAYGGFLLLAWPAAAICGLRSSSRHRWLWYAAALFLALTLVLTYSRASLVVMLAQLAVLGGGLLLQRLSSSAVRARPAIDAPRRSFARYLPTLVTLAVFGALLFVAPIRGALASLTVWHDLSLQGRLHFWRAALEMFADHPLTGVGPGGFAHAFPQYQTSWMFYSVDPHSWPLQLLAELGIVGALIALAVLAGFALWAVRTWRGGSAAPAVALLLIAAVGGSLAHAAFDFDYTFGATTALLGVLLAYGTAGLRLGVDRHIETDEYEGLEASAEADIVSGTDALVRHPARHATPAAPALRYTLAAVFCLAALYGQSLTLERMVLDSLRDRDLPPQVRERLLRQAAAFAPRNAQTKLQLAELLAQKEGRSGTEAPALVERALALNPALADAWALRAGLTRGPEQAREYLDHAIELDPYNSPSLYFARAMLEQDDAARRAVLLAGLQRVPAEHPITPQHLRGPDWYRLNPLWARWWQALANVTDDPAERETYEQRAREFQAYSEAQGLR